MSVGATVLALALWGASCLWTMHYWHGRGPGYFAAVYPGQICVGVDPNYRLGGRSGFGWDVAHGPHLWWFIHVPVYGAHLYGAPLWFFVVIGSYLSAWLWQRRPARGGVFGERECAACGYDVTGIPARGVCPECGTGVGGE